MTEISNRKMPSSEPETTVASESEPEYIIPTSEAEPRPEPLPEWEVAIETWKEFWKIHYLGFGCVFAVMGLFSCYSLYRIHRARKSMTLARYFFAVCLMVMLFCFTRSLYLLLDPYESHSVGLTLPVIVVRILFALGYPCLTSAFSLIHFAFIEVKKIRAIANRLQNIKFLTCVISLHFLIVIVVYTIVTFAPKFARLLIICQSILISWWLILAFCFLYSGGQICWQSKTSKDFFTKRKGRKDGKNATDRVGYDPVKKPNDNATSKQNQESYTTKTKKQCKTKGVSRLAKISGLVVVLGLMSAVVELYSLFAVYNLYSLSTDYVEAWPWWSYVTCGRLIEVFLCIVVAYVIFPTLKVKAREEKATSVSNSTFASRNAAHKQSKLSVSDTLGLDVVSSA